jgi:dihydroorotase
MAAIVIQGGRVIDPASGLDETADVLIDKGSIASIGRITPPAGATRVDAEGCLVVPGLIDPHVHLRQPDPEQEETIATGAEAAVRGGYSSVCCMPNTRPPIDTTQIVQELTAAGGQADRARIFLAACASRGRQGKVPALIEDLARAGAVAFTDDGDCVADRRLLVQVLALVKATGCVFMQHCQEPRLTRNAAMNAGPLAERLGHVGWPAEAEEGIVQRDLEVNAAIGCRYHAQHLSSGGSVAIVRRARAAGEPVTAEVTPHHLLLTEEACETMGPLAKVNPPLRRAEDIALLKEGVADGTITVLGTDHAPHPRKRKEKVSFAEAAFGFVGLECALALYREALVDDGVIDWPRMIAMMTLHPAKLLGIAESGLGSLRAGGPADVTVIDPDLAWTIDPEAFASRGRNCPFAGRNVRGRAIATIVGGEIKQTCSECPERFAAALAS